MTLSPRQLGIRFFAGLFAVLGAAAVLVGCGTTETETVTERVTVTETRTVANGPPYAACLQGAREQRNRVSIALESPQAKEELRGALIDGWRALMYYCATFEDYDRAIKETNRPLNPETRRTMCTRSDPWEDWSPVCQSLKGTGG